MPKTKRAAILGHAMAHELRHLLLGANTHSLGGIMRAHWDRRDLINMAKGNLGFSHDQSLKIAKLLGQRKSQNQRIIETAGKGPIPKDRESAVAECKSDYYVRA